MGSIAYNTALHGYGRHACRDPPHQSRRPRSSHSHPQNGHRPSTALPHATVHHDPNPGPGPGGNMDGHGTNHANASVNNPSFDILEWHPVYESCQRYFLDHSQHDQGTQAVCALVNIRLPCQFLYSPIMSWAAASAPLPGVGGGGGATPHYSTAAAAAAVSASQSQGAHTSNSTGPPRPGPQSPPTSVASPALVRSNFISPIPYIRRLVVTGFDKPAILHGFFGDDYERGVMPLVECERRNYLFMAKHGGWRSCKRQYDVGSGFAGDETVPFMKPLDEVGMEELSAAERSWSSWLAMEDWMVGPRAPDAAGLTGGNQGPAGHTSDDD